MTQVLERERTEITRTPVVRRATEWVVGVAGAVAAAVGAYVYYAPTDWFLGDVAESWAFGLFTGAGILLATAFGMFAYQAELEDRHMVSACGSGYCIGSCCHRGRGDFRAHLDPLTR